MVTTTATRREEVELLEALELETVIDQSTGLMWQAEGSLDRMHWAEAQSYCDDLNRESFGGFNDWRLPEIHELITLVDYTRSYPSIVFISGISCQSNYYWSGTNYESEANFAWSVGFNVGCVNCNNMYAFELYVRCVRDNSRI